MARWKLVATTSVVAAAAQAVLSTLVSLGPQVLVEVEVVAALH
jgi:hypothetical protein